MSLTYNRKIQVSFTDEQIRMLDGQSKICNWLYNRLLEACQQDYRKNNNARQLLKGRNLRNYGVSLKETHPFLKTVFSSVLKEPATRLKRAFEGFFTGEKGYPKFRSWKKKWFSLVFDEPNKGWEVRKDGTELVISLGDIPDMPKEKGKRNPSVSGKLKEKMVLHEGEIVKTCSLCKQQGNKFYAVFTIEHCSEEELAFKEAMSDYRKQVNRAKKEGSPLPKKPVFEQKEKKLPTHASWIALDPNHTNFFVGVDHQGHSIEFQQTNMMRYWDKKIDALKSKRDQCEKHYRKRKTKHGNAYTVQSPRWNRLNRALNKAYHKRREQTKTALYSIAHALYQRYDVVIIGDYTPTNGTAPFKPMKRSMLNQEAIGQFRRILEWVAMKSEKFYRKVSERNTTKHCCVCGYAEKKAPEIRSFTCSNCGTEMMRDINAAVNIGKKAGFSFDIETKKHRFHQFLYQGEARYGKKVSWIKHHQLPRSG